MNSSVPAPAPRVRRKTWIGIVVLVASHVALGLAFGAVDAVIVLGEAWQAAILWLLPSAAASWTMRRGFHLPVFATWVVMWALAIVAVHAMGNGTGDASWAGVFARNGLGLVLSFVAAMLGASIGMWRVRLR